MRAMVFIGPGQPLELREVPIPIPQENELLIRILACGVCRTDLHVVDGELKFPALPLIPGHQIVGIVEQLGSAVQNHRIGDYIGVPWLAGSCGHCPFCMAKEENLCDSAKYTGYQRPGGFAEYCTADSRFVLPLPVEESPTEVAPLLCAGLIGYRALNKIPEAKRIGFYGFGASAHILTQIAVYQKKSVYAFTRPKDVKTQRFARELGAVWAGGSDEDPPDLLDGAIIFAPEGELVPTALENIRKGGTVVCAGIHMSDIPSFSYDLLWGERHVCSVANLTRADGVAFFKIAPLVGIKTVVTTYSLENANQALDDLRAGRFTGAAVIEIAKR